jgi:hypothetical protein
LVLVLVWSSGWRFGIVARAEVIECEVCGTAVPVSARGRVPRFCADHTAADLRAAGAHEADESADPAPRQIAEAASVTDSAEPEIVDDGWPRQIAPIVWLDQNGRRYTDLGDAQRGAQEIRGR